MILWNLIVRNIKIYFRDISAVIVSLLSVVIIIVLYALFLADLQVMLLEYTIDKNENIKWLVDVWLVGGLLAIIPATASLGALQIIVEDKERNVVRDFQVSPVGKTTLTFSYLISTTIIAYIMTLFAFIISQIYILLRGGKMFDFEAIMRLMGVSFVSVIAGTAMMVFFASFVKSSKTFSVANAIIGVIIGFISGIYVPIGQLPSFLQWTIKFFPLTYSGVFFRNLLIEKPVSLVFEGLPQELKTYYLETNGIIIKFGNNSIGQMESCFILIATSIIFFGSSILVFNFLKKKRKN